MNIRVRVLSVAVAMALTACGNSGSSQTTAAEQAEAARVAELEARAQELAQREAEIAAREEEQQREALAREQAAAEAAQREREAQAKLAAERDAAAKRAAAARQAAAAATQSTPPAARTPVPPRQPAPSPIQVAAGSSLNIELVSDLSTKTHRVGDGFEARLASDLMVDGRRALPAGSRVTGTVTESISGSRAIGAVPQLALRFERVELADGRAFPISGELVQQGQSEKGRDAAKIIGGAAAGAVIGHQVKNNDKGKVVGGILGGAAGAVVARNTGTEVQLPAGSAFTIVLNQGLTLSPS